MQSEASQRQESAGPRRERDEPAAAALIHATGRRIRHVLALAASETRLAAVSGLSMLMLVIFAAASIVIAWGLVVASVLYQLAAAGISWPGAAIAFALLHALIAFACWQLTLGLSRNLTLPALRHAVGLAGTGALKGEPEVDHADSLADR